MSTSYEQKNSEHYCKDGASDSTSGNTSNIDAVSDSISRLDISNDDDDDKLFADPPPKEECPICLQPIPHARDVSAGGITGVDCLYQACCGKILCFGCVVAANEEMKKGNMKRLCPFCRKPIAWSDKECLKVYKDRVKLQGDAEALYQLGCKYAGGLLGLRRNGEKALELWDRAADLGSCNAHKNIADQYYKGERVEQDTDKAMHHYRLAAIGGHEMARHNLGAIEYNKGNNERAYKHYMIAAKAGMDNALKVVGDGYKYGYVTKDEYASTLRAYQVSVNEMKSKQRTIAASVLGEKRVKMYLK